MLVTLSQCYLLSRFGLTVATYQAGRLPTLQLKSVLQVQLRHQHPLLVRLPDSVHLLEELRDDAARI